MEQARRGPPPLPSQRNDAPESAFPANRRTAERVNVAVEVGVYSDSNFYTGFTEDVSEGGLFVATYELLPIGTEMELEFGLPGGAEFKLTGVVRWLRDPILSDDGPFPGMGVQFINLTPDDKVLIQEFVQSREPLFYAD
ncbi:MAG: TIGR02266 family protein [Myxococcota bacterium]